MDNLTAIVVPALADCCIVDLQDPASVPPSAPAGNSDAAGRVWAAHGLLRHPLNLTSVRLESTLPADWLDANVRDAGVREALRSLGVRSALLVPLIRDGTLHGVLGMFRTGPTSPPYTVADMRLADSLAGVGTSVLCTTLAVTALQAELRERERVEHELRTSVRREAQRAAEFSAIMEAVPAGVWLANDRECRNIRGNSWGYRQIRADRPGNASPTAPDTEAVARFKYFLNGVELTPELLPMHRAARLGEETRGAEYELVFPDGSHIYVLLNCVPLRDEHGVPRGALAVTQDVTRLKENERELLLHRERLEQLVEARTQALRASLERLREVERIATTGTLAAGLAHDLSNLLLPLRLRIDSLVAQRLPRQASSDVRAVAKTEEYLRRLAHNLRQLAINTDQAPEEGAHVSLRSWWHKERSLFRDALPRGVKLTGKIPAGLPRMAISSAALTQAVLNLVQNAGRAVELTPSPRVSVSARHESSSGVLQLEVSDNGTGLPPEVLEHCFEPFYSTRAREFSTGLGLAVVRALLHRARGEVSVASQPGQGATFTLVAPAVTDRARQAAPGALRPAQITVGDPRKRALVGGLLRRLGVPVARGGVKPAAKTGVWITDALTPVARLGEFVAADPGRLAIMLDPPDALPASPGICGCPSRDVARLGALLKAARPVGAAS